MDLTDKQLDILNQVKQDHNLQTVEEAIVFIITEYETILNNYYQSLCKQHILSEQNDELKQHLHNYILEKEDD